MKYRKIKAFIWIVLLIVLVYVGYYRFGYTREERIEQYFRKHESVFTALKDELLQGEEEVNEEVVAALRKKLKVTAAGVFPDSFNNRQVYLLVDFGNFMGEVEYIYNEVQLTGYTDRDGFGLIEMNRHWGFFK